MWSEHFEVESYFVDRDRAGAREILKESREKRLNQIFHSLQRNGVRLRFKLANKVDLICSTSGEKHTRFRTCYDGSTEVTVLTLLQLRLSRVSEPLRATQL